MDDIVRSRRSKAGPAGPSIVARRRLPRRDPHGNGPGGPIGVHPM